MVGARIAAPESLPRGRLRPRGRERAHWLHQEAYAMARLHDHDVRVCWVQRAFDECEELRFFRSRERRPGLR